MVVPRPPRLRPRLRPRRPPATLTVALLFLLAGVQQPSAVPAEATETASAFAGQTSQSPYAVDAETSSNNDDRVDEPMVVFGSGRRLPESAHRRILNTLRGQDPVMVRLASGEERTFANGTAFVASARSAELRGAQLIVPAEAYPCELVGDIVETEAAQRTQMVLPSGERVPYSRYMDAQQQQQQQPQQQRRHHQQHPAGGAICYPGYHPRQQQPLFHKHLNLYDWMSAVGEDVPEDELQVVLGGTQRLSMTVHEAVMHSYDAKAPVDVDLVNGRTVTVATYDELLARMVDPRYVGAQVRVGDDIKVPVETYRAVVDAHKHKGVYVVDRGDHRMLYCDYAKRRGAAETWTGKTTTTEATSDDKKGALAIASG